MTAETATLAPCPFCGAAPETEAVGENRAGLMIECANPRCAVRPHLSYYEQAAAVEGWNRRAGSALPTSVEPDARTLAAKLEEGATYLMEARDDLRDSDRGWVVEFVATARAAAAALSVERGTLEQVATELIRLSRKYAEARREYDAFHAANPHDNLPPDAWVDYKVRLEQLASRLCDTHVPLVRFAESVAALALAPVAPRGEPDWQKWEPIVAQLHALRNRPTAPNSRDLIAVESAIAEIERHHHPAASPVAPETREPECHESFDGRHEIEPPNGADPGKCRWCGVALDAGEPERETPRPSPLAEEIEEQVRRMRYEGGYSSYLVELLERAAAALLRAPEGER